MLQNKFRCGPAVLAISLIALGFVGCAENLEERRGSIYEMRLAGTPEAEAKVRVYLNDTNHDIRATALNALAGFGPADLFDRLADGIRDEHGFVRATAAKLLGDLQDPAAVPLLADRLLMDPNTWVRQRSAEALERIGGAEASAALLDGLKDPIQSVRLAAAQAAREVDPVAAMPEFSRLVLDDPVWEVRVEAARGLGEAENPELVPVLEAAINDPNEFVRAAAANALKRYGVKRSAVEIPPMEPGR